MLLTLGIPASPFRSRLHWQTVLESAYAASAPILGSDDTMKRAASESVYQHGM